MSNTSTIIGLAAVSAALSACHGEPTPLPNAPPSAQPAPTPTSTASAAPRDGEDDKRAPPVPATSAPPASAPSSAPATAKDAPRTWSFDADSAGGPPAGFSFGRTGSGKPGTWVIKAEPDAPSKPNVLAQVDADRTDYRFPVAVANEPSLRDVRLSVKCKPVAGSVDQACGLVFRYRDENNYYLTRANALENNVRLYHVKGGQRKQFEGYNGPITSKTWHDMRVDAREDHFEVYWDGKKVIDAHDKTFLAAGKVGVWTKADSVTYFDDLSATPL